MPPRIPDHTRAAIADDIRAGTKSRAQIGRDHNVAPGTVGKIAAEAGIEQPFARAQTKKATEAAVADNASARASFAAKALRLADAAIDQVAAELADASAKDAATIAGILIDKHLKLEMHDRVDDSLAAVDKWLAAMTGDK